MPSPVGEYPVVESAHSVLCDVFTQAVISRTARQRSDPIGGHDRKIAELMDGRRRQLG